MFYFFFLFGSMFIFFGSLIFTLVFHPSVSHIALASLLPAVHCMLEYVVNCPDDFFMMSYIIS